MDYCLCPIATPPPDASPLDQIGTKKFHLQLAPTNHLAKDAIAARQARPAGKKFKVAVAADSPTSSALATALS